MVVVCVIEIIFGFKKSFQDVIDKGFVCVNKIFKNVEGVWVKDQLIVFDKGEIKEYCVVMKVIFILKQVGVFQFQMIVILIEVVFFEDFI